MQPYEKQMKFRSEVLCSVPNKKSKYIKKLMKIVPTIQKNPKLGAHTGNLHLKHYIAEGLTQKLTFEKLNSNKQV